MEADKVNMYGGLGRVGLDYGKDISDEEFARRQAAWKAPAPRYERGYGWMFSKHIQQAHEGCDFDFLRTDFGAPVSEPDIY